jgi:leucyl aminopeptidase
LKASASDAELKTLKVDVLVIPYLKGEPLGAAAAALDAELDGVFARMLESREASGKFPERTSISTMGRLAAPRVVFLSLGERSRLDGYRFRNAFQFASKQTRDFCRSMAVVVDATTQKSLASALGGRAPQSVARAVAEGVALGNYHVGELKSGAKHQIEELQLVGAGTGPELAAALAEAVRLGEATNATRTLQWRPSNLLTPTDFVAEAEKLVKGTDLSVQVLERADMERLGMGALLAVARGSHQPPKLLCLRYTPKTPDGTGRVLALVGKGITFDSGGLSLKTNAGMATMKGDMSGAAAVVQAIAVIAATKPGIEVMAVAPLTENMPGGGATKPGDVVSAMNGKTIEINNTDAEGRLVLADALCWAIDQGATHLVDVATLTGAVSVALGHPVTGALGNSSELLGSIKAASVEAGERIWELPLYPEHDVALNCDIADVRNTSGASDAGTINGAIFLREFVSERPWVHLDIGGSFEHAEQRLQSLIPKGPTGVMTRTLAHLPFHLG